MGRFGSPVLVLGSADGALGFELAGRGHDVTGVEPSEFLMAEAAARKKEEPQPRLQLVHADLRSLRLSQKFKTVIAPKNALALQPDPDALDAVLATVVQHLGPEGALVFEVAGLQDGTHLEGPGGRALFTAHLRERKGAQAIRRVRRQTLTAVDIEAALAHAGLEARERFGDFDSRPWDEPDDRQIVIAGLIS
ncbi:MAG: class I SAM-dependent methyltransferase [Archangiaceae bacterium]|nr:class I SAM-dependent methyltransferase [Archangiaceae bacterium]